MYTFFLSYARDNYNAKPTATRLGDNLLNYAISLARH